MTDRTPRYRRVFSAALTDIARAVDTHDIAGAHAEGLRRAAVAHRQLQVLRAADQRDQRAHRHIGEGAVEAGNALVDDPHDDLLAKAGLLEVPRSDVGDAVAEVIDVDDTPDQPAGAPIRGLLQVGLGQARQARAKRV